MQRGWHQRQQLLEPRLQLDMRVGPAGCRKGQIFFLRRIGREISSLVAQLLAFWPPGLEGMSEGDPVLGIVKGLRSSSHLPWLDSSICSSSSLALALGF